MEVAFAELQVPGVEVRRVLRVHGREAISTLFQYELDVELELPLPDADAMIGAESTLILRDQARRRRAATSPATTCS